MCMHLKRSMEIKRLQLHGDLCTRDNVAKFKHSEEDLMATT